MRDEELAALERYNAKLIISKLMNENCLGIERAYTWISAA
jgi:hypothetical protein